MDRSILSLKGFTIRATDGEIGKVDNFYFEDATWTIRYMVVQTGNWLSDRRVLVSPISVLKTDWHDRQIFMSLTRIQVRDSPDIDTAKPVSRQHEIQLYQYYGWDYYWSSPGIWEYRYKEDKTQDPHLRSANEVIGYHIHAEDGEIGHAEDILFDEKSWQIKSILLDTSNWWFGKKVVISPETINSVVWEERQIVVGVDRKNILKRPEFSP